MKEVLDRDRAAQLLMDYLREVPFVGPTRVLSEPAFPSSRPDFLIEAKLPDRGQLIVGEIRPSGQPRLAREAANQLVRNVQSRPGSYGVFVAPYISPEAASICLRDGLGYADLAGNCYLSFDRVFIRRESHPNPFTEKRESRSLYSPRAERVLRVLLVQAGRRWRVQELAKESRVSLGHVSNVKAVLNDREWIQTEPEGFTLSQPEALLLEWAEQYRFRRHEVRDFYSMKDVSDIEQDLGTACRRMGLRYTLTAFSGAARLAPFVRYQRAFAYLDGGVEQLTGELRLKPVATGANVSLIVPYDEGIFYGATDLEGLWVASPIQLYLDLRALPGRGEDAAEFLLNEVIRPRW